MSELSRRGFVKRVAAGAVAVGMPALLGSCDRETTRGPASRAAEAGLEKGGQDVTGPYDVVEDWLQPVEDGWHHHVTGVFAQSPDRIFVTASGATPIAPPPGVRCPR